ncbi:MAG TPA: hypothetical protein VMW81_01145 [Nitrospinota bacterium]|nr:hypothetical protein [Nitrospinota bacterium]
MEILGGFFIIAGTYILSRNLFEISIQKLLNFHSEFQQLPWYIKCIIIIFGYKHRFESMDIWRSEDLPTSNYFPSRKKIHIILPFIGFLLVTAGTTILLFLK